MRVAARWSAERAYAETSRPKFFPNRRRGGQGRSRFLHMNTSAQRPFLPRQRERRRYCAEWLLHSTARCTTRHRWLKHLHLAQPRLRPTNSPLWIRQSSGRCGISNAYSRKLTKRADCLTPLAFSEPGGPRPGAAAGKRWCSLRTGKMRARRAYAAVGSERHSTTRAGVPDSVSRWAQACAESASRKLPTSLQWDGIAASATCTRNWRAMPPGHATQSTGRAAGGSLSDIAIAFLRAPRRLSSAGNRLGSAGGPLPLQPSYAGISGVCPGWRLNSWH